MDGNLKIIRLFRHKGDPKHPTKSQSNLKQWPKVTQYNIYCIVITTASTKCTPSKMMKGLNIVIFVCVSKTGRSIFYFCLIYTWVASGCPISHITFTEVISQELWRLHTRMTPLVYQSLSDVDSDSDRKVNKRINILNVRGFVILESF
jgi:hypothetical protein